MSRIRLAIEVSMFIRRHIRELFRAAAGMDVSDTAFLAEDIELGIIDELPNDSEAFRWINAVLMLMRTVYGILENAESIIEEEEGRFSI